MNHPSLDIPTCGTALQALASSSLFVTTNPRKANVPLETTAVRRSTRSNRYDGFKVNQTLDIKQAKSKVRARAVPSVMAVSTAANPVQVVPPTTPPPTSIEQIQLVGSRCGIASKDLSVEKLLDG